MKIKTQVRADLQGRDDPAAAQDRRSRTCSSSSIRATPSAGEIDGGRHASPSSNTLPDVNPDEILATLDADTRDYLRVLLSAGAEALDGRRAGAAARDLQALRAHRPRRRRKITGQLVEAAPQHQARDPQLPGAVDRAGRQGPAAGRARRLGQRELRGDRQPGAQPARGAAAAARHPRRDPRHARQTSTTLAARPRPGAQKLRPGARALGPSLRQVRPFLRETTPVIRDELRPFARDVAPDRARHARGGRGPGGGHARA